MEIKLDFGKPNPPQAEATRLFKTGKRIVLIVTGRQVGKSHYGARWTVSQTFKNDAKNKLALVIAPSFRQARVAVRKIQEVLGLSDHFKKSVVYRSQPIPTFTFPNGWIIEVHSSHDPDSLRGITADAIWYDEVALGSKESFDIVMPTLLAARGLFLGTTTPRGRHNWIYKTLYLKGQHDPNHPDHDPLLTHPAYGVVTGTIHDNAENLDELAIETLVDQYGQGSIFARQEVEGEFVSYEGLVFSWNEDQHYVTDSQVPGWSRNEENQWSFDPTQYSVIVGGLDFGWHPDPTAAIVCGYKDGQWYVLDELYETKLLLNDLATHLALLTDFYKVTTWYADSARPDNIEDLNRSGIPVLPVVKPLIQDRVKEMAMFTDQGRFWVSHRAPHTRSELGMYQYPDEEKLLRDKKRNPLDRNNHAMDAIGYALWSVRWLWRNDPRRRKETRTNRPQDDERDPYEKLSRRPARTDPSGLYGS